MAVRGRYAWDNSSKSWGVHYKPFRKFWIIFLLTVNDRLFALQSPKIVPGKVKAQYEKELFAKHQSSPRRRLKSNYLSVKSVIHDAFQRNTDKPEAGIRPSPRGSFKIVIDQSDIKEPDHPFVNKVN